jgi:L-rhamnose-H+ transport protein
VEKISVTEDLRQPGRIIVRNAALAATGGIMWYLQFFFYAWGVANIPQRLGYVNWMLHMSGYVLFGGIVGLTLGEWAGVTSRSLRLLWVGIVVIILAANLVGLGLAT